MTLYFFDSSALVKRYVHEQGTQWVQTVTAVASSPIVFVSRITWIEVQSAFARLEREQKIDAGKLTTTRQLFEYDWTNQYQIIELDQDIATQAGQLVQRYGFVPTIACNSRQRSVSIRFLPGSIHNCLPLPVLMIDF